MKAYDVIKESDVLEVGDYLQSPSRVYFGVLEADGNFNIHVGKDPNDPHKTPYPVWSTGASNPVPGSRVCLGIGVFRVFTLKPDPYGIGPATRTSIHRKCLLVLHYDSNTAGPGRGVYVTTDKPPLWASDNLDPHSTRGSVDEVAPPMHASLGDDGKLTLWQLDIWGRNTLERWDNKYSQPGSPGQPTSSIDQIEHVVLLMMENRSFDSLLGWLYENGSPGRNFPGVQQGGRAYEGLQGLDLNAFENVDATGTIR